MFNLVPLFFCPMGRSDIRQIKNVEGPMLRGGVDDSLKALRREGMLQVAAAGRRT